MAARSTQHAARSTQHAARSTHALVRVLSAVSVLTVSAQAQAAFSWATCSSQYGDYFPADIGSNETDRSLFDTSHYGLNEYQKQVRLLVNGNVHSVMFYYSNFNTELNWDFIKVEDLLGEYSYTGNLGTGSGLHYPFGYYTTSGGAITETAAAWKQPGRLWISASTDMRAGCTTASGPIADECTSSYAPTFYRTQPGAGPSPSVTLE
ncbi:MAG: hypothetical protein AMXMBFR56_26870 [Polyangiaceae bacterium]